MASAATGPAHALVRVCELPGRAARPSWGLVTFSRRPVSGTVYRGFGVPPRADRISRLARFRAGMKGALAGSSRLLRLEPIPGRGQEDAAGRTYQAVEGQFGHRASGSAERRPALVPVRQLSRLNSTARPVAQEVKA